MNHGKVTEKNKLSPEVATKSHTICYKGGDTMGGKDATLFIQNLLAEYKTISYDYKHN